MFSRQISLCAIIFFVSWSGVVATQGNVAGSITVSDTSIRHGDWVEVKWSISEAAGCWIGLYATDADLTIEDPAPSGGIYGDMPPTRNAPLKLITCALADDGHNSSGTGSHKFRLLDVRQAVQFVLFTGGEGTGASPVAKSAPISFTSSQPRQVHIALTNVPGQVRIQWVDASPSTISVRYGTSSTNLSQVATGDVTTYVASDLCGAPANKEGFFAPGFFKNVVLEDLTPNTQYYYRIQGEPEAQVPWSFRSPQPSGENISTYILVAADVGCTEPDGCRTHWSDPMATPGFSERLANITLQHLAKAKQADALLHVGDISYATGYLAKWELFMEEIQPVASRTPYMTTMGNHERDWPGTGTVGGEDSGGECGTPTEHRFVMPTKTNKQETEWYSFDVGAIHIIMMATELPCGTGSGQYAFLQADLANVDRQKTPWVIVAGHRYSVAPSGGTGPDPSDNFCHGGADLEHLFVKGQVDVALWGHVHNAMASCPVVNASCVTEASFDKGYKYLAPIHAVIGNGGQSLSGIARDQPNWVNWQYNGWGYSDITVKGAASLTMNFYADETNTIIHTFTIDRS